ncbi:NAD-dependent epimerase/dehydratase family protein [Croceimicrobium sp.]|uniref:NAD-dependent epimerase/dehydratase family protein n=1 Tax=Croceimicrobium sp. TaxID=2828340 RepID=UPI003BAD99D7
MLHTVSGATGLVGSHLVHRLLKEGKQVRALHRASSDRSLVERIFAYYGDNLSDFQMNLEWKEADLLDPIEVDEAVLGTSIFYHTAAVVSFDPRDERTLIEGNRKITAHVVNSALHHQVSRFIHVSSVAALGRKPDQHEFDEESYWVETKENSNYAKGKYAAEMEVWRGIEEGLSAAMVNPCIILGPGTWNDGSAAIFRNIAEGFKFYTQGINAYVDVRDVVEALCILAAGEQKERYIIAAENRSYQSLFTEIAKALKVSPPSLEVKPWLAGIAWRWEALKSKITGSRPLVTKETARTAQGKYYYKNDKARRELGIEFRDINSSVAFIAECYRQDFPV